MRDVLKFGRYLNHCSGFLAATMGARAAADIDSPVVLLLAIV